MHYAYMYWQFIWKHIVLLVSIFLLCFQYCLDLRSTMLFILLSSSLFIAATDPQVIYSFIGDSLLTEDLMHELYCPFSPAFMQFDANAYYWMGGHILSTGKHLDLVNLADTLSICLKWILQCCFADK